MGWSLVFESSNIGVYKILQWGSPSSSMQISLSRRQNFGDVDSRKRIDKVLAFQCCRVLNEGNEAAEDPLGQPLFQLSMAHFRHLS